MAKRRARCLTPPEKRKLWNWVVLNKDFLMREQPRDVAVAEMAEAALGFEVTKSNITGVRVNDKLTDDEGTLITWTPKMGTSVAKNYAKIATVARELIELQALMSELATSLKGFYIERRQSVPRCVKELSDMKMTDTLAEIAKLDDKLPTTSFTGSHKENN